VDFEGERSMAVDPYLFNWYAITISWSIVFLTIASIYIYLDSRRTGKTRCAKMNPANLTRDFVFVWVLLGLLILYIVSINRSSSILFAAGNIVTEVVLLAYAVKNRTRETETI
jgi:uncharacterized membrane protein